MPLVDPFFLPIERADQWAFAFQLIEKALATNRLYIIPRFIKLAQKIQAKDRHESH
jgi:hypothetical protein